MRLRRKIKRSTRQYVVVVFICLLVLGFAALSATFLISNRIRDSYQAKLDEYSQEMKDNQHAIFVATSDIKAGALITEENTDRRIEYSSQPLEAFVSTEDMGKVVLVDIPSGTHLLTSMVTDYKLSTELRELEYIAIHLGSNVNKDDTVDVRINFPNGEDYILISKKIVRGLSQEAASCLMWLDEEEILMMSAAIVDVYEYPGSKIYFAKYVDPLIQEPSTVTYTPSLPVLKLIEEDPNIVDRYSQEINKEIRKGLENRLASSFNKDVTQANWELVPDTSYASIEYKQEVEDAVELGEDNKFENNSYYALDDDKRLEEVIVIE